MKPWLWLPPGLSHDLAPFGLRALAKVVNKKNCTWRPLTWRGLQFPNPLGIAGGVDKTGKSLRAWAKLGAGFLEVGTVTPVAQTPNPGVIISRSVNHQILWNRMGFPSPGMNAIERELKRLPPLLGCPLFINIGKNRTTELDAADADYIACLNKLHDCADGFVINISSPNTTGLRDLQRADHLRKFLSSVMNSYHRDQGAPKPVLLKLSPDISRWDLEQILMTSCELPVAGFILTNSTTRRPNHLDQFPAGGGFSGRAVHDLSLTHLNDAVQILGARKSNYLLISVGGIFTPTEIRERLNIGADLVQFYSALVFSGPFFFRKSIDELQKIENS